MRVLVLNVGSSSIKGSVVESPSLAAIARAEVSLGADATKRGNLRRTVENLIRKLGGAAEVEAVGHRVVHGGTRFRSAVRIDARVLKGIEELAVFAPLHNRLAAQGIRAARSLLPGVPEIAAFDTAFHASLAEDQFLYPVPWRWQREAGIRRFGFLGRKAGMREIEKAAGTGDKRAQLALEMFVGRAAAGIAAVATTLPRLDALVFTGGIGENSAAIRTAIVHRLAVLGLAPVVARRVREDAIISEAGAGVAVLRVEAREDAVISSKVAAILSD